MDDILQTYVKFFILKLLLFLEFVLEKVWVFVA